MNDNAFSENITNEEITPLPQIQFRGEIIVVDSEKGLKEACRDLLLQPFIGFDTETRPSFKAGATNKVALLQLATPGKCYLFRLCRMKLERPVIKILESKKVLKVGADVKNDLRAMQQLRRFRPNAFVDLQSIVSEWGIAEKSVKKMAAIILDVRVSKAQRLSNWEAAELTPAQQSYAATDAWICLEMYRRLNSSPRSSLLLPGDRGAQQLKF